MTEAHLELGVLIEPSIYDSVPLFELSDLGFRRGDLTCQFGDLGVGAAAAAAAIRGRRSSRGGSRPYTRARKLGLQLG